MPATIEAPPPSNVVPPATPPKPAADVAAAAAKVQVDASKIGKEGDPTLAPPKPGSARAKIGEELRKKYGGEQPATQKSSQEPPATAPEGKTAQTQEPEAGSEGKTPDPASTPGKGAAAAAAAGEKGEKGKVSPWKLMDQFKERAAKAEARVLELEKAQVSPEKAKESSDRFSALEKEAQTMREELRYFNAEKYDPDVMKAESNYQGAWKRALAELKEVPLKNEDGSTSRNMTAEDLFTLVGMPLAEAAETADKYFGRFASEVLAYRKEIKQLFEAKQAVMEELKKTGATREQQRVEAQQKQSKEIADFTRDTYQKAVTEGLSDPKYGEYFKQKEGDDEWNSRLEKASNFVDEAIRANSTDPKLSPAEREKAVRQHAAIRNRAIGWSMMALKAARAEARAEAAEKELSEYKSTSPASGGRSSIPAPAALTGMAGLRAKLRERAKPA